MTIDSAKEIIRKAGYEPLNGACHETTTYIYACSVQSNRRCYNHPMFEVQYSKGSGWLSVTGRKPVKQA